jgi:hypothetical protein
MHHRTTMDWLDLIWTPDSSPTVPSVRNPETGQSSDLHSSTLRKLWDAVQPDTSGQELMRAVVERQAWFVPTRESIPDLVEVSPGRYRLAIPSGPPPSVKGRKKDGRGGLMVRAYAEKPEGDVSELSGRELVRSLPAEADGLLICLPDEAIRELPRFHFPELLRLADACDLEEIVAVPGLGQVERLLRATWYVVNLPGGGLDTESSLERWTPVDACTHPDRGTTWGGKWEPICGEELFRRIAADESLDGIVVNFISNLGTDKERPRAVAMGPGLLIRLLAGVDHRPGAQPLPARNRNEVELWLNLRNFPHEGRRLIDAPLQSGTLLRGVAPPGSKWRQQETLSGQWESDQNTWSPVFELADPDLDAPGYGDGPSRILCAGLLAQELRVEARGSEDAETFWQPGTWLLIGWGLDEFDRERSEQRLAIATELHRLLPEGADRVPREAILTVEGASILRHHPYAATREWIEATMRQAERFTQAWVPRWREVSES